MSYNVVLSTRVMFPRHINMRACSAPASSHSDSEQLPLWHTHAHFKLSNSLTILPCLTILPRLTILSRGCLIRRYSYGKISNINVNAFFAAQDYRTVDAFEVDVLVSTPEQLLWVNWIIKDQGEACQSRSLRHSLLKPKV